MPIILETPRLILETWTREDAPDAFEIWGDPEVMRFVGPPFADLGAARRALERAAEAQERHGVSLWKVVERSSGEVVGCCGFHLFDGGPVLELAYHLKRSRWGRGFATEAARACLRHGFEKLNAPGIVALVDPSNESSWRLLEKIGFEFKGLEACGGVDERRYEAVPGAGGAP